MDRQSLIEIFKESPTVEIEVNLTFNEIGSDKEDLLKKSQLNHYLILKV